ncbi:MAG: YciI family protein [Planctomycetaceae bacterium]|nr:YciI family protein [Planctomycetaceae bacterium]
MKVILLCYDDEPFWHAAGPEVQHAAMLEAAAVTHELAAKHKYLSASPLHPSSTATSVRIRDGRRIVTDGPFAETREVLGGYYLLSVRDLDEALDLAARHPGARVGSVEVRPVYELDLGL